MKIYKILPHLYQRGNLRHYSPERKLAELQALSIKNVVSVWNQHDPDFDLLREEIYYRHWPLADGRPPDWLDLRNEARWIAHAIQNGQGTLVYCNAGRNRSALLTAAIVTIVKGISGAEAIAHIRERRPNALANEQFVEFLEKHFP